MARNIRILTVAIAAAAAACSDSAGPADPVAPIQMNATTTKGTGVFAVDNVVFFPCVGETVHTVLNAPFTFYLVTLPSGEYVYHDHWDTQAVTGTLTGLTSGTVWTRDRFRSPFMDRSTGGGTTHWTSTGIFVSETGPTLQINEVFHVSRNAAGEIKVLKHEFNCRIAPN